MLLVAHLKMGIVMGVRVRVVGIAQRHRFVRRVLLQDQPTAPCAQRDGNLETAQIVVFIPIVVDV